MTIQSKVEGTKKLENSLYEVMLNIGNSTGLEFQYLCIRMKLEQLKYFPIGREVNVVLNPK